MTTPAPPPPLPPEVADEAHRASIAVLLLDYDGTLVGFAPTPDLAVPDDDLRALLAGLSARPGLQVHVVSGRRRDDLQRWFGALPIGLHAEHGYWSRPAGGAWAPLHPAPPAWKATVASVLDGAVRRTPGSFVEEKTASVAWHYRLVSPEIAGPRLDEVRGVLSAVAAFADLELLSGAAVLEVRGRGMHKGRVPGAALEGVPAEAAVVAVGDDRTDEDLFAALPPSALTIHVGPGPSRAAFSLPDPPAVRRFLRGFLGPRGAPPPSVPTDR